MRRRVDPATFNSWVAAVSGLVLPAELTVEWPSPDLVLQREPAGEPPALVGAALSMHSGAEVTILVRIVTETEHLMTCASLSGALAAGLTRRLRHDQQDSWVEVSLLEGHHLVSEAIRAVPHRVAVAGALVAWLLTADDAVPSWCEAWEGDPTGWHRVLQHPGGPVSRAPSSREELAETLRFVAAGYLSSRRDNHV